MHGRVIVFDGASSAGKSSVIKQLLPMLDSSYQRVGVDDFVTAVFLEQQTLQLPEKEFIARVNHACNAMYDKIRALVAEGKNVLFDTVLSGLEGEASIQDTFENLKNISVLLVLVHCPLPVLVERIKKEMSRQL